MARLAVASVAWVPADGGHKSNLYWLEYNWLV